MRLPLRNWVAEFTTTQGTGPLVLNGAVPGYASIASTFGGDTTTYYTLVSTNGEREAGIGTYTQSNNTFTRDTVKCVIQNGAYSTLGAPINLQGGTLALGLTVDVFEEVFDEIDNITLGFDPVPANFFFAGPVEGLDAIPDFRAITPTDLPIFQGPIADPATDAIGGIVPISIIADVTDDKFLHASGTWRKPAVFVGDIPIFQGPDEAGVSTAGFVPISTNENVAEEAFLSATGLWLVPATGVLLHNDFPDLQGGISGQYNHLTDAQYAIATQSAAAGRNGYLTLEDWNTFANKQPTITLTTTGTSGEATFIGNVLNIPNYSVAGGIGLGSLSATSPLQYNNTTGVFSIQVASGSQGGSLSSTDWTTFNNKQGAITLTTTGTSGTATFTSNTLNIPDYTVKTLNSNALAGSGDLDLGTVINGLTAKTTPVDADYIGLMDSAASNAAKKLSWSNIKATLKTYFDTLYKSTTPGFRSLSDNTTTVLSDEVLYHPSSDTTARTFTIDSNANVAYPNGWMLTFINDTSAGTLTIAITSDTLVLFSSGSTGSRTLAANGVATATKVSSTRWIIAGTNLT